MSNLALTPPQSDLDVAPLLLPAHVLRNDAEALNAAHELARPRACKPPGAISSASCHGRRSSSSPAAGWAVFPFPASTAARRFHS